MEHTEMQEQIQEIHLSDYWNVIRKRKALIIGFLIIVVMGTMVLSFVMTPIYRATTRLAIENESSTSPITGQKVDFASWQSLELTFNTHFKLIESKPVITNILFDPEYTRATAGEQDNVIATSILGEVKNTIRESISNLKDNVYLLLNKQKKELTEAEELELDIEGLQKQIEISNVKDTRLLAVNVIDEDPQNAALIANLLAKKYIEFDLASRLNSENQNLEWLNKEVYALKKRLEDDERKFYEYKQMAKVFSLEGKQKVIDQKIAELNNEYLETRNKRQELDTIIAEVNNQTSGTNDIPRIRSLLDNKNIDDIYTNLTNLELEQSRLAKVFKEKHPKMIQLTTEMTKVRNKLRSELRKEIDNLKVQHTVLRSREKAMEQNIAEFEKDALDTSGKELTYTILQRNMETSQNLYDTMVTKIKESGVISSGASSNIRIVENATPPLYPIKPNKKKNVLLAIVLGIFGGVGIAFFLEYLDQSMRTEEDVQNFLDLPVLAVIPIADQSERGGYY